ncbi:MAG: mannose-1-phosphate guanylyltransferase/mannose-6-phosphate isomerase [Alphaproteobacteria bacterium 41-28]|nr:MAG: mannose-1-phosphate guanylyltransferase/mannose-6-phosphate isomerase [Alphaproteobacteria bacterium 41-28]
MHAVILSGGVGSRLWPVSRDLNPKPFMKLSDGQSFLQKAFLRSHAIASVKSITTVTNKELFFRTTKEYEQIEKNSPNNFDSNYIIEPFGKNTAAAIALAAQDISGLYGKDSILLVLPSDHLILNEGAFLNAVREAENLAKEGRLVIFGMKPSSPETGYGYVEANGNDVIRFIEKPSLKQAEIYLKTDNFLWNSGMFCFSAETILYEMGMYCPDILLATQTCIQKSKLTKNIKLRSLEIDPITFAEVPENSIDYAIMEKTKRAAVVPCDIEWSDIGTWSAISELLVPDSNGNGIKGEVVIHDVKNCYIESNKRMIGAVGLEDLIIVDTSDALLVANKKNAQDVKNIYSQLKDNGHEAYKLSKTAYRPWGTYTILEEGHCFKIKRIEVNSGGSLSLQIHNHRAEHWVVVSGTALVINGDDEFTLEINQSTYIPVGIKHRLSNPGIEKLVIIEVQTGDYLGEDDIIRYDDIYGRTANAA